MTLPYGNIFTSIKTIHTGELTNQIIVNCPLSIVN